MAKKKTDPAAVSTELDTILAALGTVQLDLSDERRRLDAKVTNALGKHQARINELEQHMDELVAQATEILTTHRETLVKGNRVDGVTNGTVKLVRTPERVVIEDEEALVEILRKRGLTACIRSKETVDKAALKKEPAAAKLPGVAIVSGECVVLTPASTNLEIRQPLN